jgi:hypothetical protein
MSPAKNLGLQGLVTAGSLAWQGEGTGRSLPLASNMETFLVGVYCGLLKAWSPAGRTIER